MGIGPSGHGAGTSGFALQKASRRAFRTRGRAPNHNEGTFIGAEPRYQVLPSTLTEFITLVRDAFEAAAREGEAPVLVTSAHIRAFVRG